MPTRDQHCQTALILLRADRPGGLWDDDSSYLVEAVEDRLDDVFVTSAALTGGGASLDDAVAAVRFMGSDSAVVAVLEPAPAGSGPSLLPRWESSAMPLTLLRVGADPVRIATAYRQAASLLAATA